MAKFNILESKSCIKVWKYEVEAESEEQALEKILNGQVDHVEYWEDEDPFESFHYEVESEEEFE